MVSASVAARAVALVAIILALATAVVGALTYYSILPAQASRRGYDAESTLTG